MTRGRHTNEAYIATTGEETATDVFARSIGTDWIDRPAHEMRHDIAISDDPIQLVLDRWAGRLEPTIVPAPVAPLIDLPTPVLPAM